MQLEVTHLPQRNNPNNLDEMEGRLSPKLKLTLENVSEEPLALVNPADNCGFEIVPSLGGTSGFASAYRGCANVASGNLDVVGFAPGKGKSTSWIGASPAGTLSTPKANPTRLADSPSGKDFELFTACPMPQC